MVIPTVPHPTSKLRIAQVSPLWERVPPPKYGGVELIVSLLAEGLTQRGHDVTLFATADSITQATLEPMAPQALRGSISNFEYPCYEISMMRQIFSRQAEFDVIHFHDRCMSFFFSQQLTTPSLHTLHYSLAQEFHSLYQQFTDLNFIHISQAQAQLMPELPYQQVIYNGIELQDYPFSPTANQPPYLAFVGRLSKIKGPHLAIQIAQKAGLPLKLAGKIDEDEQDFFNAEIQPHLKDQQIEYLGEVSHTEKVQLLQGAYATLFPILWHEPFGLVMIESMACGTPVLGMSRASVPEIVQDGKTGFICDTLEDFVTAIPQVSQLSRQRCRQWVEEQFSVQRMIQDYEMAYTRLVC